MREESKLIYTDREINEATMNLGMKGINAPIKDELEIGPFEPPTHDVEGEITIDEETEVPGTRRPRKGEGWWGQGPPLRPIRKRYSREFVDGGGLCSPGRWPIDRHTLPDDYTTKRLRKVMVDGLQEALEPIGRREVMIFVPLTVLVLWFGVYPASLLDVMAGSIQVVLDSVAAGGAFVIAGR